MYHFKIFNNSSPKGDAPAILFMVLFLTSICIEQKAYDGSNMILLFTIITFIKNSRYCMT